jgi:hypothetical protein
MIQQFETVTGDPAGASDKLTELASFCDQVIVHHCTPGMTQFQQPVLIILVECQFATSLKQAAFNDKYRPKVKGKNLVN